MNCFTKETFLSGISFDKDTTYQGRGTGIGTISKENEDVSANHKTEAHYSTRREVQRIVKLAHI